MPGLSDRGSRFLGAGMTMAVATGLFTYGGYLLDESLATLPLFTVLGAVVGFTGGFIHMMTAVAPGVLRFGKQRSDGGAPPTGPRSRAERGPGGDQSESEHDSDPGSEHDSPSR